jgi:hypothetical protein
MSQVGEALTPDRRVGAGIWTVGQGWQTLAGVVVLPELGAPK